MKELQELALLHRALSSVTRLRILRMLIERPMCVNAITERLDISQPSVSQHLGILERAGLVSGKKMIDSRHHKLGVGDQIVTRGVHRIEDGMNVRLMEE